MKLFVVLLLCVSFLPDLSRAVVVVSGPMRPVKSIYYGNSGDLRRLERQAFQGRHVRQPTDALRFEMSYKSEEPSHLEPASVRIELSEQELVDVDLPEPWIPSGDLVTRFGVMDRRRRRARQK